MKVLVLVKQTPDTEARVVPSSDDPGRIDETEITFVLNPYDEIAVEEAIRIKEKLGGDVTMLTLGPERADNALRAGLAMGADTAVHLLDEQFDGLDPYQTAVVLAEAARNMEFDLVLCGRQAVDDDFSYVGPAFAEILGLPQVLLATKIDIKEGSAVVERDVEGMKLVMESPLPAVISVQKGLNEPRLPILIDIKRARKKEVTRYSAGDLGLGSDTLGHQARKMTVEQLAPPPPKAPGRKLSGTPAEMARELVRCLREEAKIL